MSRGTQALKLLPVDVRNGNRDLLGCLCGEFMNPLFVLLALALFAVFMSLVIGYGHSQFLKR